MTDFRLKRLLVPVDFSDCSTHALRFARDLAAPFQAELLLLYVVEPAVYPAELGVVVNIEQDLAERGAQQLTELAQRELPGVQYKTLVENGIAEGEITRVAETEQVDMIVMGTHGYGGIKHLLLGSTTERVIRSAPCPVLTVRGGED